ncbi:MAG: hypothetical protein WCS42_20205 [Verrucomicrobiota bacterium]
MAFAAIPLALTAISGGVSMYGSSQQAKAAKQAAEYNAALANREAHNLELETSQGIMRQRENQRTALADLANSGVQADTGTPLAIVGDGAGRFDLGIADAARAASIKAASLRAKGAMGLWEADQAGSALQIGALASGFATAGKAANMYQQDQLYGIKPFGLF